MLISICTEHQWLLVSSFACEDPYLHISLIILESALSHPPPNLYFFLSVSLTETPDQQTGAFVTVLVNMIQHSPVQKISTSSNLSTVLWKSYVGLSKDSCHGIWRLFCLQCMSILLKGNLFYYYRWWIHLLLLYANMFICSFLQPDTNQVILVLTRVSNVSMLVVYKQN